jgi:hypothetical protein
MAGHAVVRARSGKVFVKWWRQVAVTRPISIGAGGPVSSAAGWPVGLRFQSITERTVWQIVDHVVVGVVVIVVHDGWKRLPRVIAPRVTLRWRIDLSRWVVLRRSLSPRHREVD